MCFLIVSDWDNLDLVGALKQFLGDAVRITKLTVNPWVGLIVFLFYLLGKGVFGLKT